MKKITQKLMCILLLLLACLGYSQKVAVIGINHVTTDGFSFVVTQDLTAGEVIYFTENEYDNTANTFSSGEAIVAFTAGSTIAKGNVFYVEETGVSTNTFTVACTGGSGCGSAVIVGASGFSLATDGESLYAYSDSDSDPTNGVTTIHSVIYTGTTEPGVSNGGPIPAAWDPSGDYATAIVIDGFPAAQPGKVEFNTSAAARTNVTKLGLENPSNYGHAGTFAALSTQIFTNLTLVSSSPALTVAVSPTSISEGSSSVITYTFTLGSVASAPVTVNFSVGGTAVFATDYSQTGAASFSSSNGTIVIASGSSTASLTITLSTESIVEPTETIVFTITSGSGYDIGSPGAATLSITNDDTTNNDPLVALVGMSHTDPDGFSFVATKDIPPGTVIYFTENSFSNTALTFGSGESVISWTSPPSTLLKGNVIVVTETGTTTNTYTTTCSAGSGCGTTSHVSGSGDFSIATSGETMYAYSDTDNNPSNGVTDVYAVLFTGTSAVTGGTIPAIEDPSTVYSLALVVDGFASSPAPARTEYNPAGRGILVTDAIFENPSNWVFGQASPPLSTTPFANINVTDAVPPTAVCQNISVTPAPGSGSVTITAAQINNGSTDNVGIASVSVSPTTFTCANIGPNTVTLTVTDTSGNVATCTATVTVLQNTAPTFTQIGPFCSGDTFSLPTTSNNGIEGTWAPTINNAATTTYTFTPNQSLCGAPVTMTVVVNPNVVPTFNAVAPICAGDTLSTLPTTSNNGITGTWSPALDNMATTMYTFTPSSGTCVTTTTMTIVVNPLPVTPIIVSNSPACEGGMLNLSVSNLATTYSMNSNSGVAFIDIDATGTAITGLADDSEHNISIPSFTFNGVAYTTARVGMNGVIVFGSTTGDIAFTNAALPTVDVAAGNVFLAPLWEDLDIQTGARIVSQTVGNTYIIQFTTAAHDQFTTGSVTFQVQMDLVSGVISYVYQDVIFGSPSFDSGVSSTVGIQFSTTSALQYSFNTASLVNGQSITFTPVSSLSYAWSGPNSFTSTLPNPSITGLTAAANGTYTVIVTDPATNCSAQSSTTVVVNTPVAPDFTQIDPICSGASLTLPTTSNNSITGTWSPASNNTTTTTYTFTPNSGQCASTATMTVVVNPVTTNTTTASVCDTYTWSVNGQTYTSSGIYTLVTGCHTETLNLIVTASPVITCPSNITVCEGEVVNYTVGTNLGSSASINLSQTTSNVAVAGAGLACNPGGDNMFYRVYDLAALGYTQALNLNAIKFSVQEAAAPLNVTASAYTLSGPLTNENLTLLGSTVVPVSTTPLTDYTATMVGVTVPANSVLVIAYAVPSSLPNGISFVPGANAAGESTSAYIKTNDCGFAQPITYVNLGAGNVHIILNAELSDPTGSGTLTMNSGFPSGSVFPVGTTTVSYTAAIGTCTATCSFDVTVAPNVTPTFAQVGPYCTGDSFALPVTSDNGITGTWSPGIDNMSTTVYTFTPNAGQCAVTATMTIVVNQSTGNTNSVTTCGSYIWPVNGMTYAASGTYTSVSGCHTETLILTINPLPAGYNAAMAIDVTTLPYNANGDNLTSNCHTNNGGGSFAPDTWYKVTLAPCATQVFANTCGGASYDTWLTAYAQDGTTVLASNDDSCGLRSAIGFNVGTNSFVYIVVDGYNGNQGTYNLNISQNIPTVATFNSFAAVCVGSPIAPLPTFSNEGVMGTWSPAINNMATTTYTFTPTSTTCGIAPVTATIVVNIPVGDSNVFGNNVWNVYAWNAGGGTDTGSSWNTNYAGYYTTTTLGFDTQSQWCNTCAPSDAAGYQGCAVDVENHSWSAKRRGFPAAVYSIDIPSHDDEAELWINGVMVWEHVGCCDTHNAVWQGNLGSLDTVEYRATEGGGGSHGIITFNVLPSGPANLTGTYCGAVVNNMSVTLVSNYIQSAQQYRFRVRHGVTGAVIGIVDRPVNSFALSNMPGITLATTYVVDVMIRVNNVWQSFYGTPCTVTTPTPLATIGAQCGTTLTSMGQWIYATQQPNVTAYRFRITNSATSAVLVYDALNGLNKFNFNQLPASFRTAGTVYSVEVSLRNTDGTYLPYGTACNVTTPGSPPVVTRVVEVSTVFDAYAYPNPYAENFMFDVKTSTESTIQVRVYDMLGKEVENRNVEAADINSLQFGDRYPSGVYNVILSQGENVKTLRVIKR